MFHLPRHRDRCEHVRSPRPRRGGIDARCCRGFSAHLGPSGLLGEVPCRDRQPEPVTVDGVVLHWIPLGAGAGGAVVRFSGRVYEAIAATRARRPRCALFHSALDVTVDGATAVIEMAPVWTKSGGRGVVSEGPVGARFLGRARLFRYEVRCWPGGSIPDLAAEVGRPVHVSGDPDVARSILDLVPKFPAFTWGRDQLGMGDMWNSNSLVSWLLACAGVETNDLVPPLGGRAPGWEAGIVAATSSRVNRRYESESEPPLHR